MTQSNISSWAKISFAQKMKAEIPGIANSAIVASLCMYVGTMVASGVTSGRLLLVAIPIVLGFLKDFWGAGADLYARVCIAIGSAVTIIFVPFLLGITLDSTLLPFWTAIEHILLQSVVGF
jgi:hypothetical protein